MERSTSSRALIAASAVALLLFFAAFLLWDRFTASPVVLSKNLTLAVGAVVLLSALVVYQFLSAGERAARLAENIAKGRVTYSHDVFMTLFRNSSVPFIVIDGRGVIESTNSSTARLFNVELEALNSLNIFSFIEAEDETKTDLIAQYFKQGKIVSDVEVMLHRPDGTTRWVLLALFSFQDSHREKKGLMTLVDVTKQKMVDKAKTEFVSLASHQLRTPISGMKWNIELLTAAGKENLTPVQSTYLEKITHALERMDMLVGDFLSVSKLELGTLTAQYTSFNAAEFLKGIHDELEPIAKKKNIRIDLEVRQADGTTSSDSHLLHMIASNLLSNAIKYTPEGGSVRLEGAFLGPQFTIRVSDTGMGIPQEEQEMIFSKLFRASNAKSQVTDGTGLGLYIVKEAAKILGGDVTFTSIEGKGTTFTVVLPKER